MSVPLTVVLHKTNNPSPHPTPATPNPLDRLFFFQVYQPALAIMSPCWTSTSQVLRLTCSWSQWVGDLTRQVHGHGHAGHAGHVQLSTCFPTCCALQLIFGGAPLLVHCLALLFIPGEQNVTLHNRENMFDQERDLHPCGLLQDLQTASVHNFVFVLLLTLCLQFLYLCWNSLCVALLSLDSVTNSLRAVFIDLRSMKI